MLWGDNIARPRYQLLSIPRRTASESEGKAECCWQMTGRHEHCLSNSWYETDYRTRKWRTETPFHSCLKGHLKSSTQSINHCLTHLARAFHTSNALAIRQTKSPLKGRRLWTKQPSTHLLHHPRAKKKLHESCSITHDNVTNAMQYDYTSTEEANWPSQIQHPPLMEAKHHCARAPSEQQ